MSTSHDTAATGGATPTEPTLQERAGEVAATARDQASEVTSTAADEARAVAGDAKAQARSLVEDSRRHLRDQADEQSNRAAASLRDLGSQLSRMANGQGAPEGPVRDLATQAADGIQQFAETLQSKRPEEILADVKRFARQRPGTFLLGALGAGFVAGRLFRAADTDALKDAVKDGMQGDGTAQHELVSGQGSIGSPSTTTTGAAQPPFGAATAAEMVAPQPTHAAGDEPLRADRPGVREF